MVAAMNVNPERAFRHFKAKHGFDIRSQSHKNLSYIQAYLCAGNSYLASCRVHQSANEIYRKVEKYVISEGHFLTAEEQDLFHFLTAHFTLKHTTPALDKIGHTLKSLKLREESGENVSNRNTGAGTHHDHWVFLTMGLGDHRTFYVASDRSEVLIDYDKASHHPSNPLQECWVGTHLDDFEGGVVYDRVRVGGTEFKITHTKSPYLKTYEYRRADGTIFRREVPYAEEILYGRDISAGIAYQFILHMRFMGDVYRNDAFRVLKEPTVSKEEKIRKFSAFMHVIMPGGSYPEVKVFGQLPLLPEYTAIKTNTLTPEDDRLHDALIFREEKLSTYIREAKNLNIPAPHSEFPLGKLARNRFFKSSEEWKSAIELMLEKGALLNVTSFFAPSLYEGLLHSDALEWFLSLEQQHPDDPQIVHKAALSTRRMPHPLLKYLRQEWAALLTQERFEILRKHSTRVKQHDEVLLLLAASCSNELVANVLKMGVDPNARLPIGYTPLMAATFFDRTKAVECLAKAGCDLNVQVVTANSEVYEGYTALHLAIIENKLDMAKLLLSLGAATNICSASGQTALSLATGSPVLQDLLLAAGANRYASANYTEIHRGVAARITGLNGEGKKCVLVGRKRNKEGNWGDKLYFPGGFQAYKEDPVDALIREVKEETLIDLTPYLKDLKLICDYNRPDQTHSKLYMTRIYGVDLGNALSQIPFEAEDDLAALYLSPLDQLEIDPEAPFLNRYKLGGIQILASNAIALADTCNTDLLYRALHLELQGEQQLAQLVVDPEKIKEIEKLIKKGVALDTSLVEASALAGNTRVVALLKAKGVPVRKGKDESFLALNLAASKGYTQTVQELCSDVALTQADIYSAMQEAACNGHVECLQWLMNNQKLSCVCYPEILAQALKKSANLKCGIMEVMMKPLNRRLRRKAYTEILQMICSTNLEEEYDLSFVQFLLDHKASIYERNHGNSAIESALGTRYDSDIGPKLVALLLKKKGGGPDAKRFFDNCKHIFHSGHLRPILWNDGRFNLALKNRAFIHSEEKTLNLFEFIKVFAKYLLPLVCLPLLRHRIKEITSKLPSSVTVEGEGDAKIIEVTFEDRDAMESLNKIAGTIMSHEALSLRLEKLHYMNLFENKNEAAEMWALIE